MGGDDIVPEQAQQGTQAEPLEEGFDKNIGKNIDNRVALPSEGEIGAALNAATIEPEDGRAKEIEEHIELVTIESSPEWEGGTLIEEE